MVSDKYDAYAIGAQPASPGGPAIVIRVQDVGAVIKAKSGAGGLLFDLTPSTMTNLVYGQMRDKIAQGLKDEGVAADVQIAMSPPSGPPPKSEFLRGAAIGIGAGAVVTLLLRAFLTKRSR